MHTDVKLFIKKIGKQPFIVFIKLFHSNDFRYHTLVGLFVEISNQMRKKKYSKEESEEEEEERFSDVKKIRYNASHIKWNEIQSILSVVIYWRRRRTGDTDYLSVSVFVTLSFSISFKFSLLFFSFISFDFNTHRQKTKPKM